MSDSECLCLLRLTPDARHAKAFGSCEVQCGCKARGMWILNRVEDDGRGVEDAAPHYVIPDPDRGSSVSDSECF